MKVAYGIQMYSLRDTAKESLKEALRIVASQGYRYVEFAGFFGNPAEEVAAWLKEYGLAVSGTHTQAVELLPEVIEETIAYHKAIGNKNIIIPGFKIKEQADLDRLVEIINTAQPILAQHGISLGYHNHSHEFQKTEFGKYIEEELYNRTKVAFEIDTFWAFNAGVDPVDLLERMKDRLAPVIHLKDGFKAVNGEKAKGKSVGEGEAPVVAVREKALSMGLLMVIESEGQDPTGEAEVGRCISFLASLE